MFEIYINFLMRFFSLFEAQIINLEFQDNVFKGTVLYTGPNNRHLFENIYEVFNKRPWEDEDFKSDYCQDFYWEVNLNMNELIFFKKILDFIYENELNDNDRISLTDEEFKEKLIERGWNTDEINNYYEKFFFFEINMVDDGELTDSWFFHL